MTPSVSLIVCFHNAESTLERTLRSLNGQTFDDVEFIFIDDGSTDRSVDVLRTFLALNPSFADRHKLIRTIKLGTAHATQLGLEHSTGRYVMRCDADDYLDPDMLETMFRKAENDSADIGICEFAIETETGTRRWGFDYHPDGLNDCAIDTLHFSLCNKLVSRKLLVENNLRPFEGIDCWEDLGIISRAIVLSRRTAFVDRPLYHYVQTRRSLSRSHKNRLLSDHLKMALLLEDWFIHNTPPGSYDEFLQHIKFAAKVKMLRAPDRDVYQWKHTFPEINRSIMGLRHVALRHRLLFTAVNLLPTRLTQAVSDIFDRFFYRSKSTL